MQCMDFVDLLYLNLNMLWFSIEHFAKRFYNQRYQILYIYIYLYINISVFALTQYYMTKA
jgi:hypothetical protein